MGGWEGRMRRWWVGSGPAGLEGGQGSHPGEVRTHRQAHTWYEPCPPQPLS